MSELREWIKALMPAILIMLTTLSTLAAGFANMRAGMAQDTADEAVEVADEANAGAAAKSDSLRKAYQRIASLEVQLATLKTPAVRRAMAATQERARRKVQKPEQFSLWKPWTWG